MSAESNRDRDTERRSHVRYAAGGLRGSLPDRQPVSVVDLSPAGLAVTTHDRLLIDHEYDLRLEYRRRTILLPCRVAWCRLAATEPGRSGDVQPVYVAGLALRRAAGRETQELLGTFQQMAVTTLPAKLHGRAYIEPVATPGKQEWVNIRVTRISQKGLQCEVGTEPQPFGAIEVELPLAGETLKATARMSAPAEKHPELPGIYRMGLELGRLPSLKRKRLADWMAAQLEAARPALSAR